MTLPPRRKQFAVAPAADYGTLPPPPGTVLGRVPLQTVRGHDDLTDAERAIIEKAGWRPGEPVPNFRGTAVGKQLQKEVEKIREDAEDYQDLSPIDPATPPLEPPTPVDIESLPPAEQEKALRIFGEMDELQARMNAARKARAQAPHQPPPQVLAKPGAAAAIAAATAAATRERGGIELVDDIGMTDDRPISPFKLKKPAAVAAETVVPAAPEISSGDQNPTGSGADLSNTTTYCPRCNFDLNGETVVPTDEDIVAYVATLMADDARFRKEIKLFGGRIIVVFRGLLPKEVDLAIVHADKAVASGTVKHVMQYVAMVENYKMAMGIESVRRAGRGEIKLPAIADIDDKEGEPLQLLSDYLNNEIFTTDSLRSAVGAQWVRFCKLLQHIEAHASDPSFFDRTG